MKSILSKEARLGRLSIPVWTSVLALAVTGLAAGQAVGPVLVGSVTSTVGLTVEQAITLDTEGGLGSNPNLDEGAPTDFVNTFNDEGTEFTAALELHVGKNAQLEFNLVNASDADGAEILELDVPAGIDVEIVEEEFDGNISEA
jgi:hypothetical protein